MTYRFKLTTLAAALAAGTMLGSTALAQSSGPPPALPACATLTSTAVDNYVVIDPPVGIEHQTEVGGSLFTSDVLTLAEIGITLDREATVSGSYLGEDFAVALPPVALTPANIQRRFWTIPNPDVRFASGRNASKVVVGLFDNDAGTELHIMLNPGPKQKDYPVPGAAFHQQRCQRPNSNAIRVEILYGGAAKGVLSLQYREFKGGIARPAFSQDTTFDLNEGNEISFRGLHIKVLGTSNAGIRYVVTALPPHPLSGS